MRHLPLYAKFIKDNFLDEFVAYQLKLSRELNIPLLRFFKDMPEDELIVLSTKSTLLYLDSLISNTYKELNEESLQKWRADTLGILGQTDIVVDDVTLVAHLRKKTFIHFLSRYTKDVELYEGIVNDLEDVLLDYETTSLKTFVSIQEQIIKKREAQLLEAQSIAELGSFDWDLRTGKSVSTEQVHLILETSNGELEKFMAKVHAMDREKVQQAMNEAIKKTGIYNCEFRYITSNKEKIIWSRGRISYENGIPVSMQGTVMDITERHKLLEQILMKTKQLEESNSSLEEFASVASHDLKEPLRKIITFGGRLVVALGNDLSNSNKELLEKIINSSDRMRQMIDDLLSLSVISTHQEFKRESLQEILKEVLNSLEFLIEEKGAVIKADKLPDANIIPAQFRQLFQNLLANSLKFSKKEVKPVITITYSFLSYEEIKMYKLSPLTRYLKIVFSDNGIGFESKYEEKIFAIFHRLHGRSEYEGSGIGLAICKRIVEHHGGLLFAKSKENEGASFNIIIPN